MRSNALARTLVSAAAVIGLAAGGLATTGTSFAASAPGAGARSASILATQNFGLSSQQAKNMQCFLRTAPASYTGAIDGQLGTNSWKAFQRWLREYWDYNDSIDGDPGPNTIRALQRELAFGWGYTGAIDGIAGSGTKAAFKRLANDNSVFYPC
ncbi:peptidoglycan-binding domain-containing protein [Streptomyces sp. NBC_00847]|uniref:peptidoglycan-binding domain-containing protein n=1 Tax=unclassified Streptomyces TaxID=2593676 RepID=UPI002251F546|nr:peptidoglycan-binding protein [Streptomyces sp. NBC_00847]MCX4882708.1 peptidoglycan-binding protein [Streptomyces sp. NBC_00847]